MNVIVVPAVKIIGICSSLFCRQCDGLPVQRHLVGEINIILQGEGGLGPLGLFAGIELLQPLDKIDAAPGFDLPGRQGVERLPPLDMRSGHRVAEQGNLIKAASLRDPVDLGKKRVDLVSHRVQLLLAVSAVGGLDAELVRADQHLVDLVQRGVGGLHNVDAFRNVLLAAVQLRDLPAHLFRYGKTGGVVRGSVDPEAGGQLFQSFSCVRICASVLIVRAYCRYVRLDPHDPTSVYSQSSSSSKPARLISGLTRSPWKSLPPVMWRLYFSAR